MASTSPTIFLRDIQKRPRILDVLERQRDKNRLFWVMDFFAEMLGCFMYTYLGVGSIVNELDALTTGEFVLASGIQVGMAVAFGIVFAVGVCGGTSAGHFNPSFTIAHCVFRGFPVPTALRYLVAQILGAYVACLFVYYQYKFIIVQIEATLRERGTLDQLAFTPGGPAGIFAFYLPQGQSLCGAFLNEWISSAFVGIVYWASIDPSNSIITPVVSPFVSAFAYGVTIWGFGAAGVALNSARDIGSRLWVVTVWGLPALGGPFAAISALTNVPAMLFAAVLYEMLLSDSGRIVTTEALIQIRLRSNRLSKGMGPTSFDGEESGSVESRSKEAEIWDRPRDMEDHGNCMEVARLNGGATRPPSGSISVF
ncbi:aquaporin-like protein [Macrolepiota fuliginosa MF-IS2]|uniref:Aquaporin-like protein n=1 Tax=Macrolepiota fuliginosa MF-IS2 TaxID=1400762 RepID=A0A9P5X8N8_9AGAR|nr:aquaporin-like protein [Macrolepiota fuliginosa MF-IS2]